MAESLLLHISVLARYRMTCVNVSPVLFLRLLSREYMLVNDDDEEEEEEEEARALAEAAAACVDEDDDDEGAVRASVLCECMEQSLQM